MKLIVIDGLDGSGKATQTALVHEELTRRGIPSRIVSFPDYNSDSSALVKMYLRGDFGQSVTDVGPFAASAFFAVDRFASFKKDWGEDYRNDTVILCDRYTTSNAVHQMAKLPQSQWEDFLCWLYDFEFKKLGIPAPSAVIYLDMSPAATEKLLAARYHGDDSKKDIHERDRQYMENSRKAAQFAAQRDGWLTVNCCQGDVPLPPEEITARILEKMKGMD